MATLVLEHKKGNNCNFWIFYAQIVHCFKLYLLKHYCYHTQIKGLTQINLSLFPLSYMCRLSKLLLSRERPKGKGNNHLQRRIQPFYAVTWQPSYVHKKRKMDPACPAMSIRRLSLWSSYVDLSWCIWTYMYVCESRFVTLMSMWLWIWFHVCELACPCKLQLRVNLLYAFVALIWRSVSNC
jgi:hypothetical protein